MIITGRGAAWGRRTAWGLVRPGTGWGGGMAGWRAAVRLNSLAGAFEESQRAFDGHLGERAGSQRPQVDVVRRPAAVGGIGEDVVDRERAAVGHVRRPALVVGLRRGLGVAAVDENHPQRG